MTLRLRPTRLPTILALAGITLCSVASAQDSNAERLRELEKAMGVGGGASVGGSVAAPSAADPNRRIRTRGIVFDNEEKGAAPAAAQAQPQASERPQTAPAASAPSAPGQATRPQSAPTAQADAAPAPRQPAAHEARAASCGSLSPDAKGVAVAFSIQFRAGSADLTNDSRNLISEIAKVLSLSDRCVLVEGHTDVSGAADRNLALSRDRAQAVVNFISEKGGIDKARLVPMGKGSADPLPNLDARDPKNRRVVFKVVAG